MAILKNMNWILIIILTLTLFGCSNDTEPKKEPETETTQSDYIGSPNDLSIYDSNDNPYSTIIDTYCVDDGEKSCREISPWHPKDVLEFEERDTFTVSPNEEISFSTSNSEVNDFFTYHPDTITVILMDGEKEIDGEEINIRNDKFVTPSEPGVYYYSAVMTYEEEVFSGEVYYAFGLHVR